LEEQRFPWLLFIFIGSGIISTEMEQQKMHKADHFDNAVAGCSFLSFPVTGMFFICWLVLCQMSLVPIGQRKAHWSSSKLQKLLSC